VEQVCVACSTIGLGWQQRREISHKDFLSRRIVAVSLKESGEVKQPNHHCEPKLSEVESHAIMKGAIEFMESEAGIDEDVGMPSDGHRLVQKWSYSAFPHLVTNSRLTATGEIYRALLDKYGRKRSTR